MARVADGTGGATGRRLPSTVVVVLLACLAVTGRTGVTPAGASGARAQAAPAADAGDLASASEDHLIDLIDAADARRKEIEAQAAGVNREVENLRSDLNAAEDHLGALQSRQWTLEHKLDANNRQLEEARAHRQELAVDAYTGRSSALTYATSLLYADDLGALAARRSYVHFLGSNQAETVAEEERLRNEVADLLEELDGVRREMGRKQAGAAADAAQVEHDQRVSAGLLSEAETQVAERDRLFGEARSRQAEFEGELAALAAESDKVAATLRARRGLPPAPSPEAAAASAASAAASGGQLAHPMPGHAFGSPFGPRTHPVFGDVRIHTGVDIQADQGDEIHAADDGVVVSAGWLGGYGNATVLDHGGGIGTLYGHQSQLLVADGEQVRRGQVIGLVGCTGTCTGPHLHFEVRIDGVPVDPVPYIT